MSDAAEKFAYVGGQAAPPKGEYGEKWKAGEARTCALSVLGRNLDRTRLRARFEDCLATKRNYDRIVKEFRFKVGDAVECNCGEDGWSRGRVVKHLYHESWSESWSYPRGFLAPYQIQLESGTLIYCPADDGALIRKAPCRRAGGPRVRAPRRRKRT